MAAKKPPATPPATSTIRRGHGTPLRGLDVVARSPEGFGRFGRMFPELPPARYGATLQNDIDVMNDVAETMIKVDAGAHIDEPEPVDESPTIPAGYTYFGQFIDHDITLDVASSLDRATDPSAIEDFRTPRFDLDCVYGRGPDDQPYMYNPDLTMRLGPNKAPGAKSYRPDVLRAPPGTAGEGTSLSGDLDPARALLGDKRNDENSIVVQIHALFIRLHNTFMRIERDAWVAENPGLPIAWDKIFFTAQRRTRWTYQYLVIHDFVQKLLGETMFNAIWRDGDPDLRFYAPDESRFPFMPVEFSVAAYRLGHSMVRPAYALNATSPPERVPVFGTPTENNLNGFRPLPDTFGIDWGYVFGEMSDKPKGTLQVPQPSYRLDTLLVGPLSNLPDKQGEADVKKRSLPALNLRRGVSLGLPSGQAVARRMKLVPLSDDELWCDAGNLPPATDPDNGKLRAARAALLTKHKSLRGNAPLWYYILREAELTEQAPVALPGGESQAMGGGRLGAVGGRIIAEVFMGLLQQDEQSFLTLHPRWRPAGLDGDPTAAFTMETLTKFVDAPPKTALEPS